MLPARPKGLSRP